MSVADLIRQRGTSTAPLSPQDLVARYRRLRGVCKDLNNAMVHRFAKDALHEGGRKLGMMQGNTLVFGNEDDMSVLMDYCLYHVRRNGRNAVEQYCCDHPPVAGTDEAACLRAMQNAIYSLFRVDAIEPGVGLAVTDVATDEQYLVGRYWTFADGQAGRRVLLAAPVVRGLRCNRRSGHPPGLAFE